MNLGEKIRLARQSAGMTQSQLAGDFITRNMLSQIENGLAMPSLQTALYIADKLGIDAGILFSDGDDRNGYFLTKRLPEMKKLFSNREYDKVIEIFSCEYEECDEAVLILAECHIKKAYSSYKEGKLRQVLKHSESAVKMVQKGFYSSESIRLKAEALEVMVSTVLPLLKQTKHKEDAIEALKEFYIDYTGQKSVYNKRIDAKKLIEEEKYDKACSFIKGILKEPNLDVPFVYDLYCDLEKCYSEIKDFENAYEYAKKVKQLFNDMQS